MGTAPDPAFWRGRRVLVTGHTGFKGAWLHLWLEALGAEVIGLSGPAPTEPSLFALAAVDPGLEGDVRDPGAVEAALRRGRPEVVLHLAAQALVRRSLREPAETFSVNVTGTAVLLEAVARAGEGVRAVVVVTSDKVYRDRGGEQGHREDDELGGRDPYSASKAAQEHVAAALRDSLLAPLGVGVATARAGNVIGGGDWAEDRLVPDFVRAATAREELLVRHPAAVRPWQHVLCPLAGYLRLAERLHAEPAEHATAYNFGPAHEDARPVSDLVARLRASWPHPVAVRTGSVAAHETAVLRVDAARARARLGWVPAWDLGAGMDATVEWYAAQHAGADARELCLGQIERYAATAAPGSAAPLPSVP